MRNKIELIKRYSLFFVGVIANAVGLALITSGMLGTGPTACIPYILSKKFPLSLGVFNFFFYMLLLLCQILMLRKDFKKYQLLQLPAALLFSACLDGMMYILSFINPDRYYLAIIVTVVGCVIRAFGITCQLIADVVMLPSEAFVKAVSNISKKDFSICKLVSDAIMVAITAGLSFWWFGKIMGVREGTLITVLLVGPISHFFTKNLSYTNHYLENEGEFIYETKFKLVEGKRLVITITSEAGSGGRFIARILGTILNIPVYDKELIDMVAEEGNFSKAFVRRHNEKLYRNALHAFFMENYSFSDWFADYISDDSDDDSNRNYERYRELFEAQSKVITDLAQKKDCIIVGHCSNYVLKDFAGVINIFITSDMEHRIEYIAEKYLLERDKARARIEKQDADTYEYYKHFVGHDWKDPNGYHITINSSQFGYEGTAEIIDHIVRHNYIAVPKVKVRELRKKYNLEK